MGVSLGLLLNCLSIGLQQNAHLYDVSVRGHLVGVRAVMLFLYVLVLHFRSHLGYVRSSSRFVIAWAHLCLKHGQ